MTETMANWTSHPNLPTESGSSKDSTASEPNWDSNASKQKKTEVRIPLNKRRFGYFSTENEIQIPRNKNKTEIQIPLQKLRFE